MDSSLHTHERTGMAHLTCGYPAWASLFTGVDIFRRGPAASVREASERWREQEWTEIVEAGTDDAEVKRAVAFCCPSVVDALLKEDDAAELAQLLGALADPVRLRLLSLVAARAESARATSRRHWGKASQRSRTTPKCWPTPACWSVRNAADGCGGGSTRPGWRPSAERSALRSRGFFERAAAEPGAGASRGAGSRPASSFSRTGSRGRKRCQMTSIWAPPPGASPTLHFPP